HRHADRAVDLGLRQLVALLEQVVEMVERAARLLGGRRVALDRELVALGPDVDAELLLDARQILVELAVQRACLLVVVEGQDDMRHVRCPGRGGLQVRFGAQASLLLRTVALPQTGSEKRLAWPVFVIRTLTMSPIPPAFSSTITG